MGLLFLLKVFVNVEEEEFHKGAGVRVTGWVPVWWREWECLGGGSCD